MKNRVQTPLTQAQMGIYLECVEHEGEQAYHIPYLYVFDKSLDAERLCRAVETAIKAHPTCFTRLRLNEEGMPVMSVDAAEELRLEVERSEGARLERKDFESLLKPFQLLGGRLFQAHVLEDAEHVYLLWNCHHLINDGSSMQILLHDIETAYGGGTIMPETITQADVAEAEKALRATEAFEEGKRWYAETFDCADLNTGLLPDLTPDSSQPTPNSSLLTPHSSRPLDINLEQLEAFCQKNGIYKSTLMTVAYAFMLARYNNEEASLTRTAYNGRADSRLNRTQGMFVRTLPVYCRFDKDTTVLQLLHRQQEQMQGCRQHEAYSYMDMMHDLQLQTNTTFVWHGELFNDTQLMGSPMKTIPLLPDKNSGDLIYFKAYILEGHIWLQVEYESVYSRELVAAFIESYEAAVNGMLTRERLCDISLTHERQWARLDAFNQTDMPIDPTETVLSVFAQMVAKQPDKTAVVYKEHQYTYREVDEWSDRLAAHISSKGLGVGDVVSILVPRSEWMVIAPLGVLKAGCAYQPLDPTYPKERLNFMMQDAGVRLLIADEGLQHLVSGYEGEVLLTSSLLTPNTLPLAPCPLTLAPCPLPLTPHSLFVLLYTSGSTGTPKGVMLEHRNMMAFCRMHHKMNRLDADSRVGAYASFGFDACLQELWAPLTIGATIYIIPEEMRLDLIALNDYFHQNHITHGFMTTQVARQFVNDIDNHSLQVFVTGGEKLADITPPPYLLINGYGPTESICYVTAYEVREKKQNIPIGKAVPNTHLFIVDNYGHRQPIGAAGELWVSGPQVGRGYLNQPEKTAEAFISNPFDHSQTLSPALPHNGEGDLPDGSPHYGGDVRQDREGLQYSRCYRTGDIVRYLSDGTIEYVGRRDAQVKIRGFRIELKEVEGVIRQYQGIKDVTVQAFDQEGGGKYIAAYVVSDETVDVHALHAFILEKKPPYMVPAVTMQIDRIPLTQNHKVNKRALPQPEKGTTISEQQPAQAPLNLLEQELHDMIASIIHTEDFNITTPLVYAGLTSIMAIQLAVRVNKRFGVTLNSKSLVKTGTLQSIENEILKEYMEDPLRPDGHLPHHGENHPASLPPHDGGGVGRGSSQRTFPLSYAQTGVYVECVKQPLSTLYNIPAKVALPEKTDAVQLAEVVKALVKAHPQLSVSFDMENGSIVQTVHSDLPIDVPITQMTEKELEAYKQDFVKPFNLSKGPLCRMEVVQTERRVYLLMDIHHLVADGASIDLLLHQLCCALEGSPVETERYTYAQYVNDQKEAENGAPHREAQAFFREQLGECEEVTEVPADLTNPISRGETASVSCPFDLTAVEQFCRNHHLTPAHLTLAAVFYTLSRFTNNERVTLTTISNGRADVRTADTVGMFVNTLMMSAKVTDQRVLDFLRGISELFDATLQHENYPFARIAADYGLSAEIMFACQLGVLNRYTVGGRALEIENMELNVPKFRIAFYIQECAGMPSVTIDYDNGRYSEGLMRSMAQSVAAALTAFVKEPEARLLKVSLLGQAQVKALDAFNQTEVPYDESQTIVSLFCRQVALHPDNVAVVYHNRRYTYREVDDISQRLAAFIASRGLGAGDVVSILIPRCEWMVIASMGVLKAGCAYQPLDPSYPSERLNFMMQDANARLLIADEELRPLVSDYKGEVLFTSSLLTSNPLPLAPCPLTLDPCPLPLTPHSLFILLYTSGSTGTPKGVMLEHRNLVAFCHWYQRYYQLDESSRVAAYASYGFDASMMDVYPALTCGASIYIIGDDIRLNLPDLNDYFNVQGITHSFITTQVGYQFAVNVENHSLRHFSVGGEKLAALQPPTHYKMHNGYGPTECTIFTTTYQLAQYEQDIPIGKPVDNMKLYIVDKDLNRLPLGAMGELWISGSQVGRGYLNQPERTAEAFIPNPFEHPLTPNSSLLTPHSSQYSRVYRTGDIVRYLPDGNIQFVGRRDGQVKIRGFRIELKEVEAVIREYKGIKDATVQAFDYADGGKYIAAYIVSDEQVDVKALHRFIAQKKPSYMVPAATMQIDSIPLNQNQKVNRRALPQPVMQMEDTDYVEPANDMERLFCQMFGDILGMERYSATANFFEQGGTSLTATRIIIEAEKARHHVAYGDVFAHPTPRGLAAFLAEHSVTGDSVADTADSQFDYTSIGTLLMCNTLKAFREGERQRLGRVLLTGATGYLGIHVLKELIDRDDVAEIYCLVRAEDADKGERRLKRLLFYYFGKSFKELFGNRLHVVLGDVTNDLGAALGDCGIDTVFNCAAIVKHFSAGTEIEDVNIGGVMNCVRFCIEKGARLIHVSTYSTAGLSVNGSPAPDTVQTEQMLYYGQYMDNRYVHSKFVAERTVLEAASLHGLNAKVMRVGNLAPRSTDGEFQINAETNSAMGRVRVFKTLGCYPYEWTDQPMEFSPVDEVARAIVLLSETPRECCLFHPFNNHSVHFGDVLQELRLIGDAPRQVETADYERALEQAKSDPEKARWLQSLLAYQDLAHGQKAVAIRTSNDYTTQVLYRMGFRWSSTSWDYVGRFLTAIDGLGYFNH